MAISERVWGFLHPDQWIRLTELKDMAHQLRAALADSTIDGMYAHLTRSERDKRAKRNQKVMAQFDRLTSRMNTSQRF